MTEVPLSKTPNPLCSLGATDVCVCVFSLLTNNVCTNLDRFNAEFKFRVWVTLLDLHMSLSLYTGKKINIYIFFNE